MSMESNMTRLEKVVKGMLPTFVVVERE